MLIEEKLKTLEIKEKIKVLTAKEKIRNISTIGPKIASSVLAFFHEERNRDIISRLKAAGLKMEAAATSNTTLPLAGKEFVITGTLKAFPRAQAEARIKELGGDAKDNVTRKTSYVVVGEDPGSKKAKAEKMGIPILDEQQFLDMLK